MKRLSSSRFLFALLLFAAGTILLLFNLNIISLGIKNIFHAIYPYLLFVLGVFWTSKGFSRRGGSRLFWGLFTVIFSILLIGERFGYIENFGFWDFWRLWPFVLIYMALSLVFSKEKPVTVIRYERDESNKKVKSNSNIKDEIKEILMQDIDKDEIRNLVRDAINKDNDRKEQGEILEEDDDFHFEFDMEKEETSSQTQVNVLGLKVGDYEFNTANWPLEPLYLKHTIGNYYIDLTKAFIPEGETPIVIKGKIGDAEILLPEDLHVKIAAKTSIGSMTIFDNDTSSAGSNSVYVYESEGYENARRRVFLQVSFTIGSVTIDRV